MRELILCGKPVSAFSILLSGTPQPAERTAAAFLQNVIRTSCGVTLPILPSGGANTIRIGTEPPASGVRWDGFRIRTDEAHVYLDGLIPRGTLFAAYGFAERYLGYRKLSSDTEVFSAEGKAELPANTERIENPTFEERRCDWVEFQKDPELCAHSRLFSLGEPIPEELGAQPDSPWSCHSFYQFLPGKEYFESHPEYYSLHNGVRHSCDGGYGPGQLCLTHPDVLRIVTENALKRLKANPGARTLELSQCDNENYCECDACKAVDEAEGSHAGSLIRFVNAVAEAVEKEFPDVLVRTFAYMYSVKPPKLTRARHNVIIRYCTIHGCFRHAIDDPACEKNRETMAREITGWGERCDRMCIWDYLTNWCSYLTPFPNLYALKENVRVFDECHALQVFEEDHPNCPGGGLYPELRAYLVGLLLWNARLSDEEFESEIDLFLKGYYGPGWRELRTVMQIEQAATKDRCFSCNEEIDIGLCYYYSAPKIPELPRYMRRNYRALAYQPILPNHALLPFCERMDEVQACFDRAEAAAETDLQREHLHKSRVSVNYLKLFCMPHDRDSMSEEARKRYEAEVKAFFADKEKYGLHYNIQTDVFGQ